MLKIEKCFSLKKLSILLPFYFCLLPLFLVLFLAGCASYISPPREQWNSYLSGASLTDMTADAIVAKRPVYLGAGGTVVGADNIRPQYGDPNAFVTNYMTELEYELYDALRVPGVSVQRAGTDVVVILVRDSFMKMDVAEISDTGADTLQTIAKILNKYKATFLEIAGYTDQMRDQDAARAMSLDMARRAGVALVRNRILPARMFIAGRGSMRPIAAQDDMGRLMNRRIEIRIAPAR